MSSLPPPRPATVLRESGRARNGLFGFLAVVFTAAAVLPLVRNDHHDTDDWIAMGVMAVIAVVVVLVWVRLARHPQRLVISDGAIVLERKGVPRPVDVINGSDAGRRLSLVLGGPVRSRTWALAGPSGERISLQFFDRREVAAVCERHGWQIG